MKEIEKPLDKQLNLCYNNNVKRKVARRQPHTTLKRKRKEISKKFSNALDKPPRRWYNKDKIKERDDNHLKGQKGNKVAEKMTQKNAIAYVLENCEIPKEVEEKLVSMKAQLEKKSKSGERKPTKTQVANEGFKKIILDNMEQGRLYTISELTKEMPFGEELSSQRVSAIVSQLKKSGEIVRTEDKRKAFFSLA